MRREQSDPQPGRTRGIVIGVLACIVVTTVVLALTRERPKPSLIQEALGIEPPEPPPVWRLLFARTVGAAVATPVTALCLAAGAKLTKIRHAEFQTLLLIALLGQSAGMVPYVGPIVGLVVMCVLVTQWLEIDFLWDGALMVLVADAVAIWLSFVLRSSVAAA